MLTNKSDHLKRGAWVAFWFALAPAFLTAAEPIQVVPYPDAGKSVRVHNSDRPRIAVYGGVGLRSQGEGGRAWTDYGELNRAEVDYLLDRCKTNGVFRIHANLLETLSPADPQLSEEERKELVSYFFRSANARGIEVFADMPVFGFFVEADRDFVASHPDAFTRTASGESDSHMLSAANEEVRRYKRSRLMEFVRDYPVSGLQLDFIRYPYYTLDLRVGYGKHGYDPLALATYRQNNPTGDSSLPTPNEPEWVRHKANFVSQFIRELRADLVASKRELPISVYNSGTYGREDSLRTVHQDWEQWGKEGLVDEHHPMFLMSDGLTLLARATQSLLKVKQDSKVFGPIFLAEGFRPAEGDIPTPDMVRKAARSMIKLGCDGLWVCRPSEVEKFGLWPVLNEISQWSLSEIRAEDFDPFAENLLSAGSEWKLTSEQSDSASPSLKTTDSSVLVELSPATPARMTRSVGFRANRHLAAQALVFSCQIIPPVAVNAPKLEVTLHYFDGSHEKLQFDIPPQSEAGASKSIVIPVKCDFSGIVLTKVDLSFTLPPGSGAFEIANATLHRDPQLWQVD